MSEVFPRTSRAGDLTLHQYDFPEVGDEIPEHAHDESDVHVTFVVDGTFRMFSSVFGEKVVKQGGMVNWRVGERHRIVAMTKNARVFNVPKNIR